MNVCKVVNPTVSWIINKSDRNYKLGHKDAPWTNQGVRLLGIAFLTE